MSESSDEDSDWEALGRGFPDLSRLSLKFQWDTFMSELQQGTSLSGALDRLQTLKAKWDTMVLNLPLYAERKSEDEEGGEALGEAQDGEGKEENKLRSGSTNSGVSGAISRIWAGSRWNGGHVVETDPTVVTKIHANGHLLYTNDLVMPMDKEYTELTHWDQRFNEDEDALRSRIIKIRSLTDLTDEQKASMIQTLMMKHSTVPGLAMGDHHEETAGATAESGAQQQLPSYNFEPPEPTEEDKRDVYQSPGVKGCPHYQRNCKLLCSQCNKWVPCRICHDEAIEDHQFQRNATQWVLCTNCFHHQSPSSHCEECGIEFAMYYCPICVLYDNDESKDIYHCDKCGICRLGLGLGQDFFHCDQCNACLSIELLGNHKCIENSTKSDCPICHEYMFTSTMAVVYMDPCGHAIHQHCFDEYVKHSYKCPNCSVSVINMEREFRILSQEIQEYRLPEPYCYWKCKVHCNDCRKKSMVDYHILGLCCQHCGSYNTRQVDLIKPEDAPATSGTSGTATSTTTGTTTTTSTTTSTTTGTSTSTSSGADSHGSTPRDLRPRNSTVSSFHPDRNEELQQLRDELLHSNFQRETVSSHWALDQNRLRHMDEYLRAMVESSSADADADAANGNGGDPDDNIGFAARIKNFIATQTPDSSTLPQLSQAFAAFLGSTHQGLSSSDEDD